MALLGIHDNINSAEAVDAIRAMLMSVGARMEYCGLGPNFGGSGHLTTWRISGGHKTFQAQVNFTDSHCCHVPFNVGRAPLWRVNLADPDALTILFSYLHLLCAITDKQHNKLSSLLTRA